MKRDEGCLGCLRRLRRLRSLVSLRKISLHSLNSLLSLLSHFLLFPLFPNFSSFPFFSPKPSLAPQDSNGRSSWEVTDVRLLQSLIVRFGERGWKTCFTRPRSTKTISAIADNNRAKTSRPKRHRLCESYYPQKKSRDWQFHLGFACHIVPNHRTFIDDYLKIVEFIEWLKDFYPEKAAFLTK